MGPPMYRKLSDLIDRAMGQLSDYIPTEPKKAPLPFDNPTDRKIAQIIFDCGDPMLPSGIRGQLKRMGTDISENAIYQRLWKMEEKGIVEHYRGEGFEIKLGRRYFPLVPLVVSLLTHAVGIAMWKVPLMVAGTAFFFSLVFYWLYEH